MKTEGLGGFRRLMAGVLLLLGAGVVAGADPADGAFASLMLGGHLIGLLFAGVFLIFWRDRRLVRAGIFLLALLSFIFTVAVFPGPESHRQLNEYTFFVLPVAVPLLFSVAASFGARAWRKRARAGGS